MLVHVQAAAQTPIAKSISTSTRHGLVPMEADPPVAKPEERGELQVRKVVERVTKGSLRLFSLQVLCLRLRIRPPLVHL